MSWDIMPKVVDEMGYYVKGSDSKVGSPEADLSASRV